MSKRKKEKSPAPDRETTPAGDGGTATDEPRKRGKGRAHGKGGGTLVLRGGIYQARWVVNGKVYVRSTKTGVKRDAEDRLKEFTAEYRTKDEKKIVENLAARTQGITAEIARFEDAKPALALVAGFAAYRESKERPDTGAATMGMYESQYFRLVNWAKQNAPEATEMRHITREIAGRFMGYLAGELSANSYNKYLTLFTRIWKVIGETARVTVNPWEKIRPKTVQAFTRRELTVEELMRVFGAVTGEMRVLFVLGTYTGLRLGDCALLGWGNIDMVRGIISTIPRKTARHANGKPVVIPLHSVLAAVLGEIEEDKRTGFVVPGIAKMYAHDSAAVTDRVQRVFSGCGIATTEKADGEKRAHVVVGFHSLRHTFVSMAENAGVPLPLVQSIVGHSNPMMTAHYFHADETALKNAIDTLPNVIEAEIVDESAGTVPGVPCAFCVALDGMTREQLEAARAEIDKRLAAMDNINTKGEK